MKTCLASAINQSLQNSNMLKSIVNDQQFYTSLNTRCEVYKTIHKDNPLYTSLVNIVNDVIYNLTELKNKQDNDFIQKYSIENLQILISILSSNEKEQLGWLFNTIY